VDNFAPYIPTILGSTVNRYLLQVYTRIGTGNDGEEEGSADHEKDFSFA